MLGKVMISAVTPFRVLRARCMSASVVFSTFSVAAAIVRNRYVVLICSDWEVIDFETMDSVVLFGVSCFGCVVLCGGFVGVS